MVKITRNMSSMFYLSIIPIYGYRVSGVGSAAGLKNGQFDRIKKLMNVEHRTSNIE